MPGLLSAEAAPNRRLIGWHLPILNCGLWNANMSDTHNEPFNAYSGIHHTVCDADAHTRVAFIFRTYNFEPIIEDLIGIR